MGIRFKSIFFSLIFLNVSIAIDTMTPHQAIRDGGQSTLVSSGGTFELGFFSPGGSSARYLGIWYNNIPADQTVVWVANREAPLSTVSTGVVNFTSDGNLVLYDRPGGSAVWSTTNSSSAAADPKVRLLDSGNLVIMTTGGRSIVWQSFDHPTDTMLPGMKIGMDLRTNMEWSLTSWKTTSDPSPGPYSYRMDPHGDPEIYIWTNGSALPKFRTGPWNGHGLSGVPYMRSNAIFSFDFISNQDTIYNTYQVLNSSILCRLVLNQNGVIQRFMWHDGTPGWILYWSIPQDQCDVYGECGVYGVCNAGDSPICKCLRGFDPKSPEKLIVRDASDGCARRTKLNCGSAGDGFLMVTGLKLPRTWNATMVSNITPDDCRDQCLRNCSCMAFNSFSEGSGCINWFGDLMDIREFTEGGQDLYVRLAASELDARSTSHVLVIVTVTTSLALLILSSLLYFIWRCRYRGRRQMSKLLKLGKDKLSRKQQESKERGSEFSVFRFSCIADATNNFSAENKLGEGGFGPVYKGQLPEGQEIAVKRLSTRSGQGLNEFNNEILLIAKLQHRNLVRLLGFCIQGEEKLLIYEYMPNKSLDHFLFGPVRSVQLNWGRRLHIIEGIAQGLLYLHKYSRLRIIHRDLKASNVLLDDDMTPKISDFGMARIFGSEEAQANTNRIVGTYGYMPPEYAMKGHFSTKFDVFSFGVLLLEIISGKRNASPHQYRDSLNLLGHAWKLWKEGQGLELIDPSLENECHVHEISKVIHVALMCVQESASDRPTMSDVITMLSSESSALPDPKQPAFFMVRGVVEEDSSSSIPNTCSVNNVTTSVIDGR